MVNKEQFNNLLPALEIIWGNINEDINNLEYLSPKSYLEKCSDKDIINNCPTLIKDGKLLNILYNNKSLDNFNHLLLELFDMKFIFLDTETTGIVNARPVQISIIVTDCYLNILESKNFYIYQSNIEEEALNVHKLTPEFLKQNETLPEKVIEYLHSLDNRYNNKVTLAYNARFDIAVMRRFLLDNKSAIPEFLDYNICLFNNTEIRAMIKDHVKGKKLTDIVTHLNLNNDIHLLLQNLGYNGLHAHNAIYDVCALVCLIQHLKGR